MGGDSQMQPGAPTEVARPNAPTAPTSTTSQKYHQGPPTTGEYAAPGFPPMTAQQSYGANQFPSTQGHSRTGPFNMTSMANVLPPGDYRAPQYGQGPQRFQQPSASQVHMPQYGAQGMMNAMAGQHYYMHQQAQMPQYYASPMSPTQHPGNASARAGAAYYPAAMGMAQQSQAPAQYYYAQAPPYQCQPQAMHAQIMQAQYMSSAPPAVDPKMAQAYLGHLAGAGSPYSTDQGNISPGCRQNVVRGPPRKPKQSGHAIWIGNLPPQTELMSLVHHVCKETKGLESLFLISKSNCAFANYKDEPTCIAAQQDLHDSRFQSVRLVSRLRKSTVEGVAGQTAPTGPATSNSQAGTTQKADEKLPLEDQDEPSKEASTSSPDEPAQRDKFFVLKSLTVEDLELSVRTNIWATQAHNEEALNAAFKSVENVYLIFSANKSGEYFGYARMTSSIDEDPAAAIEFAPSAQVTGQVDLPKAIPTEATEFAPRGRIIDDSARGTIFWEAERPGSPVTNGSESQDNDETGDGGDSGSARSSEQLQEAGDGGPSKAWGKPFRLEWMSTTRLPFYRTRGLRNPWNSNREVKIARDGTELEPTVGRRLIGLFNRAQSPAGNGNGMPAMAYGAGGVAMGPTGPSGVPMVTGGYPVMRPPWSG